MGEITVWHKVGLSPPARTPTVREQTGAIGGEVIERTTATLSVPSINRTKQSEKLGLRRSHAQFGS
jgi:hypothetical protein